MHRNGYDVFYSQFSHQHVSADITAIFRVILLLLLLLLLLQEYKGTNVGSCVAVISQQLKLLYEGWNFNSGNYLFTTDTK